MRWTTDERIANTQDDALFQTERFGRGSDLKYCIPVPETGDYLVRLYFAENFFSGPNERKFHIAIEGKLEMANVDIYEMAKNKNRAVSRSFRTVVSGDCVELDFIKVKQNVSVILALLPFLDLVVCTFDTHYLLFTTVYYSAYSPR